MFVHNSFVSGYNVTPIFFAAKPVFVIAVCVVNENNIVLATCRIMKKIRGSMIGAA
jgi:hypothetical protein